MKTKQLTFQEESHQPQTGFIECWFDGAVEPRNPGGHGSWGALIKRNGKVIKAWSGYVGFGDKISNNVAEYVGCAAVLQEASNHDGVIICRGDSKLVIMQLSGKWKVRNQNGLYVPYYHRAKAICDELRIRLRLEWIPRELNGECDDLSKSELVKRGIYFDIQPMEMR